MVTIGKIMEVLAELAPWDLAESWDRVGLQVGRPDQSVGRLMVALDLSPRVLEEGLNHGVDGFVIHHPLIFKPLTQIRTDFANGRLVAGLLKHDISVIAAHTNVDKAANGLNLFLATRLGLVDTKPLEPLPDLQYKVVVYTPESHAMKLREAMSAAGAGKIGDYTDCSFTIGGTGRFKPGNNASPYAGETNRLENIDEVRLEMRAERSHLSKIIETVRNVHPYEEPVVDVFQLTEERRKAVHGLGKIGRLPESVAIKEFSACVKTALNIPSVKLIGEPDRKIQRVALCGGSGGSLLQHAIQNKAELYLTGELNYHDDLIAQDAGIAVIEAGHWGTEHIFSDLIASYLGEHFSSEKLEVIASRAVEAEPYVIV